LLIFLGIYVIVPLIMSRGKPNSEIEKDHSHPHQHDHSHHDHTHPHSHSENGHTHIHKKSALTGALQGLGGSAALMLVTLTTVSSVVTGLAFIFIFGVGVILGMIGIACIVGSIMAYTASNLEKVHQIIKAVTGTVSIIFGIYIIVNILI
jgi:ABC-type nickel/cobalt efflux system permease component RcnA